MQKSLFYWKYIFLYEALTRDILQSEVIALAKRKANHVINGMNNAKRQGNGAGYIEDDQHILTEAERQNNKKRKTNQ